MPKQRLPDRAAVVEGYLDSVGADEVVGWAWVAAEPERRVALEVLLDGEPVARVTAERPRA